MSAKPFSSLHQSLDGSPQTDTPGDSDKENNSPQHPEQEALRAEISAEFQHELAMERFQQEHPDLWIQVNRMGNLMELQEECENGLFPPGSCFIYANVPCYQNFAVKRVLGVDLDTCQTQLDIYGDSELEEGTVILPLESISWYGFPQNAIPLNFAYSGFSTKRPTGMS
jgi:hypothetical protein